MNASIIIKIAFWGILYLLVQVLVMKGINLGWDEKVYMQVFFYPIFLLTLPFKIPQYAILLVGFSLGLSLDFFYDSPGVHSFACVLLSYSRKWVTILLEPRGGYAVNASPTYDSMGASWFLSYTALLLFLHIFSYFCIEIFTFAYLGTILVKTVFSFLLSFVIIILFHYVLSPLES
jgi:hypothetical protein